MIRKFLLGACIGGLLMGQVYEAPREQKAQQIKWTQDLSSSNQKKREMAQGQLLQLARSTGISNRAAAEGIYLQILANDPNCKQAHIRLAEMYLGGFKGKPNALIMNWDCST